MTFLLLASLGFADVPPDVRPVVAPAGVQQQYASWAERHGKPKAKLACEPFWGTDAQLCFRTAQGWVTRDQLATWQIGFDSLRSEVARRSRANVDERLVQETVGGMKATYWRTSPEDPRGETVLLHPDLLEAKVGAPLLVAVPASGIVLAWKADGGEVDKILTVGAREIHASSPGKVTPVVYRWTGDVWVAHAEAVPSGAED